MLPLRKSRPGSDGNKVVLCISQSSSITGASPSNCLTLCPKQSFFFWWGVTSLRWRGFESQRCHEYIFINQRIGLVGWVFANDPGDRVQSQVESYQRLKKWYLIPPCLTLSYIRYISRVKWSNPGKGVAPSPTPRCSSYRKGGLWVALDYSHQLYFTLPLCRDAVDVFYSPSRLGHELNLGAMVTKL